MVALSVNLFCEFLSFIVIISTYTIWLPTPSSFVFFPVDECAWLIMWSHSDKLLLTYYRRVSSLWGTHIMYAVSSSEYDVSNII